MNSMDRLKQSLAIAGWEIGGHYRDDPREVGWSASKLVLELSQQHEVTRYLVIVPMRVESMEYVDVRLCGCSNDRDLWWSFEIRDLMLDEVMPSLQRIARTLVAAFKAADKEWA